jgi:hypothetical protein
MAQRTSEYERKERDLYETPEWVTEALIPYLGEYAKPGPLAVKKLKVWEPACASGRMSTVLSKYFDVYSSDLVTDYGTANIDFLETTKEFVQRQSIDGIITNPPFGRVGAKFMRHAISLLAETPGFVAMLAPLVFDSATLRDDLFGPNSPFDSKVVLTKRIVWFEREEGEDEAAPSSNHAWYIWIPQRCPKPPEIYYVYP